MLPYEPLDQYLDQQDREDDPDSYPGPDKEPGAQILPTRAHDGPGNHTNRKELT